MSIDKQMKQHPTCRQQYKYTYLSGPLGLFAIHIIKPDGTAEINYIHTDHLGSWNTITDESGNLLQELSFDACKVKLGFCECSETKTLVEPISYEARGREGNRRDPATWENYNYNMPSFITDRGYTGHVKQPFGLLISANQLRMLIPQRNDCGEHLDEFILINMNGRMYDPETARFLSPDVVIADPSNPASYNPYAYVLNNPLKYTDPSGYFVDPVSITAYIIAGAILYSSFAKQNADPATGKWDWNFTNWSSEDKPGWMLGITINTSFTNTTFFASMNWSNGSNTTLGYNTQYGWGGGSAPQNMYFPNYNSGASEAAAVSSIARVSSFNMTSTQGSYMDNLIYNTMTRTIVFAFNQFHVVSSIGPLGFTFYGSDGGIYFANSSSGFERNMGNPFDGGTNLIMLWDNNGDGKLQKSEADSWWLLGGGDITVDNSKINWTGLKIPVNAEVGKIFSINTTEAFKTLPYETAATYGGTSFILRGAYTVEVIDQLYHYEYRLNNSVENIARNAMTWWGKPSRQGTDFTIHYINPKIIIK